MFIILWWKDDDDYLTAVTNDDGSIRVFETLKEADNFANSHWESNNMRVISMEGVDEGNFEDIKV